jgi:hypothetical protein
LKGVGLAFHPAIQASMAAAPDLLAGDFGE